MAFCIQKYLFIFFFSYSTAQAQNTPTLSLFQAEQAALQNSLDAQKAQLYIDSLEQQIRSTDSFNYPKLVLEGSYKYSEVVPKLDSSPMGTIYLGDNDNYSIGPALLFNLFDGGRVRHTVQSLQKLRQSQISEKSYIQAMVQFSVRLSYINILINEEQYLLASDSLTFSKTQNEDIKRKRRLGALSELDLSLSHRDLINQKLKKMSAKQNLEKAIIDFASLLSKDPEHLILYTPTSFDFRGGKKVRFDSLEKTLDYMEKEHLKSMPTPPQLASIEQKIQSTQKELQAEKSKYWPQLSIKLKTSLDYPNGPDLSQIHQNTIGVNLSMPIYDWGEISGSKNIKKIQLQILETSHAQIKKDLFKEKEKLKLELKSLKDQEQLAKDLVEEAKKIVRINLSAFRSGRIQYTEVERANIKKFEAQVQQLILKGQIFSKLSQMIALSNGGLTHE